MKQNISHQQWKMKSEVGDLYLVASATGLKGVYNRKQDVAMVKAVEENKILKTTEKQLTEYFAGKRKIFDLKLELDGTEFQKKVWNALLQIPYGKTCSYKDIAEKIKNKKAVRAVGGANGKNPICVIVPCHRVISADGTLGGYSSGIPMKIKLLKLESA